MKILQLLQWIKQLFLRNCYSKEKQENHSESEKPISKFPRTIDQLHDKQPIYLDYKFPLGFSYRFRSSSAPEDTLLCIHHSQEGTSRPKLP